MPTRHFLGYHNADKIGLSSTTISEPYVRTDNAVKGLAGVTVWLIAGEGKKKKAKSFYIASKFTADKCETNFFAGEERANKISGPGSLYELLKPIPAILLLKLKKKTRYFENGFHELKDSGIIADLEALV